MPEPSARRRINWRPAVRALHRDCGYLAIGLTIVYAVSGLAVNHIGQWDPDFVTFRRTHRLSNRLPTDDREAARSVLGELKITAPVRDVFRAGPDRLDIALDDRTLNVDPQKGTVLERGRRPRWMLRAVNWLHLNRGKKAWRVIADGYAIGLLFLAISGMFMLTGRKGMWGRGGILTLLGIAIPVLYVAFSGGPR